MSKIVGTEIPCPDCKNIQTCSVYHSINIKLNPELKEKFMSGDWNIFRCKICKYTTPISSNMMYHDMDNKFVISYVPDESAHQYLKSLKRYESILGVGNYFSNPVICRNKEDMITMVYLCGKSGPPRTEDQKILFLKAIKNYRNSHKK